MTLAYSEYGRGEPVLVLHGLFGSRRNWQSIAKQLAEDFRVIALDLRNHGDSPWRDTMSYPEMAGDVVALMDRLGLARAAVIGHSMGGKVAMAMALGAGTRVQPVVVVDITPVARETGFLTIVEAMRRLDVTAVRTRGQAEDWLGRDIPDAATRRFLLQNLVSTDGGYNWRINLSAIEGEMATLAGFPDYGQAVYSGPALFIAAGGSDYVRPADLPAIRGLFPQAVVQTIPGADHWVHISHPQPFLAQVRRFLVGFEGEGITR